MLIDAHQHFWRIGENGHEWPTPDLPAIHRDFLPDDWIAAAVPSRITASVLVQSQPSAADTDWLLELAETRSFVKAVVGWTDLKAPDAASAVDALARRPKLRGLRPMLQNLPEDDWISTPELDPAVAAMVGHGLTFDALVYTRHLPHLRAFAQRWPDLPIVIDHAAKPPISSGALDPWRAEIAACAALPNVYCKLSGLLTEAAPGQDRDELRPFVRHLVHAFGAERLMWGSDWPVLLLAGDLGEWHALAQDLTGFTDSHELDQLFGRTAERFYGLELQ